MQSTAAARVVVYSEKGAIFKSRLYEGTNHEWKHMFLTTVGNQFGHGLPRELLESSSYFQMQKVISIHLVIDVARWQKLCSLKTVFHMAEDFIGMLPNGADLFCVIAHLPLSLSLFGLECRSTDQYIDATKNSTARMFFPSLETLSLAKVVSNRSVSFSSLHEQFGLR